MKQSVFTYPEAYSSVQEFLTTTATSNGSRPFVIVPDINQEITYSEVKKLWGFGAAFLQSEGIRKHDRVLLALSNSLEYILALGSIFLAGAVPIIVNPNTDSGQLKELALLINAHHIIGYKPVMGLTHYSPDTFLLSTLMQRNGDYKEVITQLDDIAYIIFTSGSTGKMKGTKISQKIGRAHV